MRLFEWIRAGTKDEITASRFQIEFVPTGVVVRFREPLNEASVKALVSITDEASASDTYLIAYLSQLVIDESCHLNTAELTLPWSLIYKLKADPDHGASLEALTLPKDSSIAPILNCEGTLADAEFELVVAGWVVDGAEAAVSRVCGAIVTIDGEDRLLSEPAWRTSDSIGRFNLRSPEKRTQHENELAWGRIRQCADAAGALYRTPYLETTFVLTPETLRLPLSRQDTPFGRVLIVEPTFEGAPPGWIRAFDGFQSVQMHYDLTPPGGGHVRVVLSEPVRQVLSVIKRDMPARKVAGSRAERFIKNPWAFLGEAAHEVLREEEFAQDKAGAGPIGSAFSLRTRYKESRIEAVEAIVTESIADRFRTITAVLDAPANLGELLTAIEAALDGDKASFPWKEYDLGIDGETTRTLEDGRATLRAWSTQPAQAISFEDIYELEGYNSRIEGIGVAKAIYVPLIQRPRGENDEDTGWLPSDLTPLVRVTLAGHEGQVVIPLTAEWVTEFGDQVRTAVASGATEVSNASLPTSVPTAQAQTLLDGFRAMLAAPAKVKGPGFGKERVDRPAKQTLLVKSNFHKVDYAEERKSNLALPAGAVARLPKALRRSISLKKHQLHGVAWFQHLVSRAPVDCRGALLADDMGLGKTLQLLTVLAQFYEQSPNAPPTMILAPKSLVQNWKSETVKFFTESFPKTLVMYGDTLRKCKQPLSLIDEQLQSRGFVELLKPDWVGTAKIVITTYEVLISYEFSFARQPFAFLICDEAQRIKTPGTQVATAVRALKADFRIVCTGTPVENSLADLWCLFDFVQPGLLGGLDEFGRKYRRPIECDTEDQKDALRQLQEAIAPQTLRRTKLELKHEFKKKFFACRRIGDPAIAFKEVLDRNDRLEVSISAHQDILYLGGLKKLQDASEEQDGRRRARASFGALHLMKAVCAEPYCIPGTRFLPDTAGHDQHLKNSAKLADLIDHLKRVRDVREKAIIFTELREVQNCLFYFMKHIFGLKPSIINGDSENRQTYIDEFSATEGFDVIILSTLAAGAGLNVVAANHVFHFTRAWNPAKESQATDRAYRIGQEKDVFVYCPIIVAEKYPTFDVRLDEMLRRKAGLADATLGDSAANESVLEAMLNGTGNDVTFSELMSEGVAGAKLERRLLTMDDVDRLDGFSFEVLCKLLWSKAGYLSQVTPKRGGDGGIDVLAVKGREGELLQCKSSGGNDVGWDAVKEVTAGAAKYQARFPGVLFRRLAVTNQRFNLGARDQAAANRVTLVERDRLELLLRTHPVSNYEFDGELFEASPLLEASW
jgi:HJR/Mrr/RecB family endonuclease